MNLKQVPGAPASAARVDRPTVARVDTAPVAGPLAPAPAVSVKVSDQAAGTAAMAAAASQAPLGDRELLLALKERIQADDYQIDYERLAGALVETALQAVGGHRVR